jgi:hypothetical protein
MDTLKGRSAASWLGFGAAWLRYGHAKHPAKAEDEDSLLDRFIPTYEIAERHHVSVAAAADITFSTACAMDLQDSGIIRAIFKTRELLLHSTAQEDTLPRGLLAQTEALGWCVLAEIPGREIVMGAVTQPWKGTPIFRGVPPDQFAAFHEPGYVKIAWTLRADSTGPDKSLFRTETRAVCADEEARRRFRRYWAFLSPGIILIRRLSLGPLKKAAQYRARLRRLERNPALVL